MKTEGGPQAAPQSLSRDRSQPSGGAEGTLRRARAEALYEHFAMPGFGRRPLWLPLDAYAYACLRRAGLLRRDVEQALRDLAAEGRVEFETRRGVVLLRTVVERERAAA